MFKMLSLLIFYNIPVVYRFMSPLKMFHDIDWNPERNWLLSWTYTSEGALWNHCLLFSGRCDILRRLKGYNYAVMGLEPFIERGLVLFPFIRIIKQRIYYSFCIMYYVQNRYLMLSGYITLYMKSSIARNWFLISVKDIQDY